MAQRKVNKTEGHYLAGDAVTFDDELNFVTTANPEIDSQGGGFLWKTLTNIINSWRLRDDVTGEDILSVDTQTAVKTVTLHPNYTAVGFGGGGASAWTRVTQNLSPRTAAANEFILVNSATVIVDLPAPTDNAVIAVKTIVTPIDIQIKTSGAGINIDGTDYSATGLSLTSQWEQISLISDGVHWYIY